MFKNYTGFTLVEVIVVVSIIAILSTVAFVGIQESQRQGRDAERQSDLRNLQSALELYKLEYGRYPAGCRATGEWSGQLGTAFACPLGSGQYIVGLAPEFIPVLPIDPRLNGVSSGYVYSVDAEGNVYKLMALSTIESETVTYSNPFSRCDDPNNGATECSSVPNNPLGNAAYNTGGTESPYCTPQEISRTYSLVGGFAAGGIWGVYRSTDRAREYFSDIIRCK
jgi:prepilin-type N-terminal cleavage/methylation domain-containing protein